jgi:hypothetical protein
LLAGSVAAESTPALRVEIQGDSSLPRGSHVSVPILVELARPDSAPLLLTPSIEGGAIELLRGRLLAADAKRLDPTHLRFELPVFARSEGTAILRIELSAYVCSERCRRVSASDSRVLIVR